MQASYGGIGAALLGSLLLGQAPVTPSFEVASIQPSAPFSFERMQSGQMHLVTIRGNKAVFTFVSLPDLLAYAYRVKPYQVVGPASMRDGRWDIAATLPDGATADQVPDMVRNLLVERFKLQAHREPREHPVFELVVDKSGLKLKEAPPEDPSTSRAATAESIVPLGGIVGVPNATTRMSQAPTGGMRMEMSRVTMRSLADVLTPFVERPVVDRTNLTAVYKVTLDLPFEAMSRVIQSQAGSASIPVGFGVGGGGFVPGGPSTASDPTGPSITDAVQRLGLTLHPASAPIDTIVIDHLDKVPTEN